MTYFVMPNWLFYIFVTLIGHGVLWLFLVIGAGIYLHVKEKKEKKEAEKAFFTPVECKDEDELIRMQALFPGKYSAEELLSISGGCSSLLEGCYIGGSELLEKAYECLETELTEEQEDCVEWRIQQASGVMGFIGFMQAHGIDVYLRYLQNGEIFFEEEAIERPNNISCEDKPERAEAGDAECKFSTIRLFKREKPIQNNVVPYVNGSMRVPRLMDMVHYSEDKPNE